jgi:uncharacterized protein YlxW (UPF0749 family)
MATENQSERTTDRPVSHGGTGPSAALPPQATMGLLDYITATSLDEDYAHVSERRDRRGESREIRPSVAALIVLGLFGLLVATAALQTSRNAVASEDSRAELVTQIKARSAQLDSRRGRIADLRAEIDGLQSQFLETTAQGRTLSTRLSRLGVRTGAAAVTGPGVRVVVDDAPNATTAQQQVLDKDLQRLVNALWASGAEAVSINGQRLSNLSAIRHAGPAITVNFRSLSRPYVVLAVGDPDTMPARFVETQHGSAWLDLQAAYGLQFEMTSEESLTLPAVDRLSLRHATTPEGDR